MQGRLAAALALSWAILGVPAFRAATAPEAEPTFPASGAVVGARPVFHVMLPGLDDAELRETRLRIRIEPASGAGRDLVFDQRRRAAGWARGEDREMLFRPPRPIPDGPYAWSVEAWDGTAWGARSGAIRFRVDTVPPGPVANLRAVRDAERGVIRLEWDPVTVDVEGSAEYVARYHVYRYPQASDQQIVRAFQVAETEDTRVELPYDATDPEEGRWFLRVTAEDQAGNVAERPH